MQQWIRSAGCRGYVEVPGFTWDSTYLHRDIDHAAKYSYMEKTHTFLLLKC